MSFNLVIEHYTDAWRADKNKIGISLHNESIPYFRKALLQIESLASATQNINAPTDMDWNTPLHLISKSRYSNIQFAAILLKFGADVNAINFFGNSALHFAVSCGNTNMVKFLLDNGASVQANNYQNCNPLHLVLYDFLDPNDNYLWRYSKTFHDIFILLLAAGGDVNQRNNAGRTPLYSQACSNISSLRAIVAAGGDVFSKCSKSCYPLNIAAADGDAECVNFLLQNGVQIDVEALQSALNENNHANVKALLAAGAHIDLYDDGIMATKECFNDRENNCLKYLLALDDDQDTLNALFKDIAGAEFYVIESLETLIAAGANPDAVDENGNTVLEDMLEWISDDQDDVVLFLEELDETDDLTTLPWYAQRRAEIDDARTELLSMIPQPQIVEVCIGLQQLRLPALVTLEIINMLFERNFHFNQTQMTMYKKWKLITAVKHFKR